jgi:hypothetical protein
MTKAFYERGLRIWMIVFAISFVIADFLFLFGQEPLFKFLNWQAQQIGMPPSPAPDGNQWFFLALTNSMMVMITYMAVAIAYKPWTYFSYLPVLIVSKTTSALTGLAFFLSTHYSNAACLMQGKLACAYFSNLSVFTSDFPLAIIAVVLYVQGRRFVTAEPRPGMV